VVTCRASTGKGTPLSRSRRAPDHRLTAGPALASSKIAVRRRLLQKKCTRGARSGDREAQGRVGAVLGATAASLGATDASIMQERALCALMSRVARVHCGLSWSPAGLDRRRTWRWQRTCRWRRIGRQVAVAARLAALWVKGSVVPVGAVPNEAGDRHGTAAAQRSQKRGDNRDRSELQRSVGAPLAGRPGNRALRPYRCGSGCRSTGRRWGKVRRWWGKVRRWGRRWMCRGGLGDRLAERRPVAWLLDGGRITRPCRRAGRCGRLWVVRRLSGLAHGNS
jgi:hypothetical protein